MDPLSAIVLGLVQALTEFLPVSSSGHLVLAHEILDVSQKEGLAADAFAVAVHFGTLLSVIVVFWSDIKNLVIAFLSSLKAPRSIPAGLRQDPQLQLVAAIVIGCIPAGLVGLLFKDELESAFSSTRLVCTALIATGCILLLTRIFSGGVKTVSLGTGLVIGLAQAVAIIPGVSRSGSTIAVALFLCLEREHAARYSFLLSLPVIAGASLLKSLELMGQALPTSAWTSLGLGAGVAFFVGILALRMLMLVVRRGAFAHFGWYCLALGSAGLFLIK